MKNGQKESKYYLEKLPVTPPNNEKQLLLQVAEGDEYAFKILFDSSHSKLAGYVMGWTKSEVTTEEIVQDVFLKIWLGREKLKGVNDFDKYLYTISRNYTFNTLRAIARERVRFAEWLKQTDADPSENDDLLQSKLDYTSLIREAVEQLPAQQRKVYELKYVRGMKYDSIGAELNIAPETARKHMQAATRSITEFLRDHLPILAIIFKII